MTNDDVVRDRVAQVGSPAPVDLPVARLSVFSGAVVDIIVTEFLRRLLQNEDIGSLQRAIATGAICGDDPRVGRMLRCIAERAWDPNLRLEHVARAGRVSTSSAVRLLKQYTARSFVTHVRQVRVTAACSLLEGTSSSIKEIAARVGYNSARHFARDFTHVQGLSPLAYRRAHWS